MRCDVSHFPSRKGVSTYFCDLGLYLRKEAETLRASISPCCYGVASISRLLKIISLFCKRAL